MQRIVLIVVLLLVALTSSYQMFSTNAHHKREVQAKLDELSQAVETQDPAKVKKTA